MYYVYILVDELDNIYVGYSGDLKRRFDEHLKGKVNTTSKFKNTKLYYYESYSNEKLARVRELKLKQYGSAYHGLIKRIGLK